MCLCFTTVYLYICLYILQINLPDSVAKRCAHSLSTFIMGPHCVWLIVVGGYQYSDDRIAITHPNITTLVELGK